MTTIQRARDTSVGSKFLAINNSSLLESMAEALGISALDNVQILQPKGGGGGRLFITVKLPDLTVDIPELGGSLTPQLFMRNANDGSSALHVGVGLFRLICSNGLAIPIGDTQYDVIRHVDGPKTNEYLDRLPSILMQRVNDIVNGSIWDSCIDAIETPVIDPVDIISSIPGLTKGAREASINAAVNGTGRPEDRPDTAWGIYNLVNEMARRRGRSAYRSSTNDVGMLDHVIALAQHQAAKAA